MKKLLLLAIIALGTITFAKAQVSVNINAGFNVGPCHGVVYAQPVPPPVRAYAPVVYVTPPPPPVYYAPRPVYVERRGYYNDRYYRDRGCGWRGGRGYRY